MCFLRFPIARIRKAICVKIARYLSIHGSSRVAKNMERCFKNFTVIFISLWPNLAKSFCWWLPLLAMTQNCPKNSRQLSPMKGAWLFLLRFWVYLAKSSIGYVRRAVHDFKPASARHESGRKKDSSLAAWCCCCRRPRCLLLLLLQKLDHREFNL
jgi:hypothetical protein